MKTLSKFEMVNFLILIVMLTLNRF
jgi:hypothetical protein